MTEKQLRQLIREQILDRFEEKKQQLVESLKRKKGNS